MEGDCKTTAQLVEQEDVKKYLMNGMQVRLNGDNIRRTWIFLHFPLFSDHPNHNELLALLIRQISFTEVDRLQSFLLTSKDDHLRRKYEIFLEGFIPRIFEQNNSEELLDNLLRKDSVKGNLLRTKFATNIILKIQEKFKKEIENAITVVDVSSIIINYLFTKREITLDFPD